APIDRIHLPRTHGAAVPLAGCDNARAAQLPRRPPDRPAPACAAGRRSRTVSPAGTTRPAVAAEAHEETRRGCRTGCSRSTRDTPTRHLRHFDLAPGDRR